MTSLTFVGQSYAKIGFRFYYTGPNALCPKNCQLYATCHENLDPNKVYQVIEIMKRTLECPKDLHSEKLVLVKVKIPELEVTIPTKEIFEGSIVKYTAINCELEDCPNYQYCTPSELMIASSSKVKILEKVRKVKNCAKNNVLAVVKIEKRE
jgi:uncharacterized protein (UPF0179 family)